MKNDSKLIRERNKLFWIIFLLGTWNPRKSTSSGFGYFVLENRSVSGEHLRSNFGILSSSLGIVFGFLCRHNRVQKWSNNESKNFEKWFFRISKWRKFCMKNWEFKTSWENQNCFKTFGAHWLTGGGGIKGARVRTCQSDSNIFNHLASTPKASRFTIYQLWSQQVASYLKLLK